MLGKTADPERLTAGVFARARASGIGYLGEAAGMVHDGAVSVADGFSDGIEQSLQVKPVAERKQRLRLAPSPRVATLVAVFMLVIAVLVVGWQVLSAPAAPPPDGVLSAAATDTKNQPPGLALQAAGKSAGVAGSGDQPGEQPGDQADSGPRTAPQLYLPGTNGTEIVVHVAGAVHHPGLVHLSDPSRVADALESAGGPLPEADLSALNLARLVVDGEMIYVPRPGETPPPSASKPGTNTGSGGAGGDSDLVNLNTADLGALQSLSGIGPALAQRILDYRETNGKFTSVDQLDEVSGIGPALMERLRGHVTV